MPSSNKSMMAMCAADIMSRSITMIPREISLQGAARLLSHASVSGAPVVDSDGRCIGVLSTTDFMRSVDKDGQPRHKTPANGDAMCQAWQMPNLDSEPRCSVEDFMTKDPVLVSPGTTIGELARMMMDAHIHRIIVVDAGKKPIGIVSTTDILAVIVRQDQAQTNPGARTAKEVPALVWR